MEALTESMERLIAASEWFARTPTLRMLHVAVSESTRDAALQHICAAKLVDPDSLPYFVLERPTDRDNDGWEFRAGELRMDWAELARYWESPVGTWPVCEAGTSIERFRLELQNALAALPLGTSSLVIVLAPRWIHDAEGWQRDLESLIAARVLRKVRLIIVETDTTYTESLIARMGSRAIGVDARAASSESERRCLGASPSYVSLRSAHPLESGEAERGDPEQLERLHRHQKNGGQGAS